MQNNDITGIEEVGGSVPFGPNTEKSILSLAFDSPEFFQTVGSFLLPKHFRLVETQFVFAMLKKMWNETDYLPTRTMARDRALKELTVDDDYIPILEIIDRESDRREIPFVKKELTNFARDRAFGVLFSEEGISAYEAHDYDKLETIFSEARKITDVTANGLTFFDGLDILFDQSNRKTFTSGFPKVDRMIEGGGPAKGEILCWMAPTGVGKCHTLSSKIWEKKMSQIFEIEVEISGGLVTKTAKLAGFREVLTQRGLVHVYDLTKEDRVSLEWPFKQDEGDLFLGATSYQSITFGGIFPDEIEPETPTKSEGYEVYTPTGWEDVLGFYKTQPMETVILSYDNYISDIKTVNKIECAYDHLIMTKDGLKKAVNCDKVLIDTIHGYKRCEVVKTNVQKTLYDLQIADPHIWYTSGIASHNSILLPHSGIACLKRGCNVLHITCELSIAKTALRYAGAISNVEIHKRFEAPQRAKMMQALERVKTTYKGDLKIYEFPPDEVSVDQIYHLITQLRRQWNWHPDVVVIDYLELLISRRDSDNVNDYVKQKQVSTQLRGLAINEDVLVFTATQTNRMDPKAGGGGGGGLIGLNRVAESYGKVKPMDYVLSANQEMEEYNSENPQLRLFFAKNRNGEKNKVIPVSINYKTFRMAEITTNRVTKK